MKSSQVKNVPASIQRRLSTLAQKNGRPYNEVLQYYAIERFLYRLSQSQYRNQFLLKGALIFLAWGMAQHRPTRDIDLLGYTSNEIGRLVEIIREICAVPVLEDGLSFEPRSVQGERITEDADYEGVRVRFQAHLGSSRLHLQIDVGFADVVSPEPQSLDYPTLLSMPAPELRGYPPETVVAEKLQAMIFLGTINSRMKDFYDLWALATRFEFRGPDLQEAILGTFKQRETGFPEDIPALTESFVAAKQAQWQAFITRSLLDHAPAQLQAAIQVIDQFAGPVLAACRSGEVFDQRWKPGGPWGKAAARKKT